MANLERLYSRKVTVKLVIDDPPLLCLAAVAAHLCWTGSVRLTPRSGDQKTVVRSHMVMKCCKGLTLHSAVCLYCCVFYLNFLFYIVKDEPLGVDEVIGGVEGDGVQWSAINATSIHRPASRF